MFAEGGLVFRHTDASPESVLIESESGVTNHNDLSDGIALCLAFRFSDVFEATVSVDITSGVTPMKMAEFSLNSNGG